MTVIPSAEEAVVLSESVEETVVATDDDEVIVTSICTLAAVTDTLTELLSTLSIDAKLL